VQVFENEVSAAEADSIAAIAKEFANIAPDKPRSTTTRASAEIEPLQEYASFALQNDEEQTLAAIELALKQGRPDRIQEWLQYGPYQQNETLTTALREFVNKMDREGAGVRIFKLKKLKLEHPQHPGIDFLLGMSYFVTGQTEAAEASHTAAIKADQGRTNLSTEALRCMAEVAKRSDRPQAAAYCFAHLLRLDRNNPTRLAEAKAFFEAAKVGEQAAPLLEGGISAIKIVLPEMKIVRGDKKLTAEELFTAAAPSVVLIRTDSGSGSGVCVGARGIFLTNAHVVDARGGDVLVTGFKIDGEKIEKLKPQKAQVLFRSDTEDLAILKVADPPESIVPLALEEKVLQPGAKVYAVGHPGLGDEVLEQSITDGIVSSANRAIGAKRYVQHTAAVNPGNSGGPLLNEHGHIVGIVTLKANLENVGFAIPASRLRAIYEALREK
jgi:S1-C subfamily serine protease